MTLAVADTKFFQPKAWKLMKTQMTILEQLGVMKAMNELNEQTEQIVKGQNLIT